MYGYKLQKPTALPKILWACKTRVEQYRWENRNRSDMIEFSICRAPARTLILSDGTSEQIEGESFSCLMGAEPCQSYAKDGVPVEILSVAGSFEGLSYESGELDAEAVAEKDRILLPRLQREMSESLVTRLENLLYQVMELYKEHCASAEVMCGAVVLRILFELDQMTRKSIQSKKDKYVHYYVDKTESILSRRYAEHLTVKEVAEELAISPNYLSALFKSTTGVGFTERLLEIRMKKAAALLGEGKYSESEVATRVGYEETGHFRKRFKQYFGVSVRDYRCINQELTLYHEKPERR